jgi:hypothetical protein
VPMAGVPIAVVTVRIVRVSVKEVNGVVVEVVVVVPHTQGHSSPATSQLTRAHQWGLHDVVTVVVVQWQGQSY